MSEVPLYSNTIIYLPCSREVPRSFRIRVEFRIPEFGFRVPELGFGIRVQSKTAGWTRGVVIRAPRSRFGIEVQNRTGGWNRGWAGRSGIRDSGSGVRVCHEVLRKSSLVCMYLDCHVRIITRFFITSIQKCIYMTMWAAPVGGFGGFGGGVLEDARLERDVEHVVVHAAPGFRVSRFGFRASKIGVRVSAQKRSLHSGYSKQTLTPSGLFHICPAGYRPEPYGLNSRPSLMWQPSGRLTSTSSVWLKMCSSYTTPFQQQRQNKRATQNFPSLGSHRGITQPRSAPQPLVLPDLLWPRHIPVSQHNRQSK